MRKIDFLRRRKQLLMDTIQDLKNEWYSVKEIAQDFNCSVQNICYIQKWKITNKTVEKYLSKLWIK